MLVNPFASGSSAIHWIILFIILGISIGIIKHVGSKIIQVIIIIIVVGLFALKLFAQSGF